MLNLSKNPNDDKFFLLLEEQINTNVVYIHTYIKIYNLYDAVLTSLFEMAYLFLVIDNKIIIVHLKV
jgi:hypothetical protein